MRWDRPELKDQKPSLCPHGKRKSRCRECGGASFCEHGRNRDWCKECGGKRLCEHQVCLSRRLVGSSGVQCSGFACACCVHLCLPLPAPACKDRFIRMSTDALRGKQRQKHQCRECCGNLSRRHHEWLLCLCHMSPYAQLTPRAMRRSGRHVPAQDARPVCWQEQSRPAARQPRQV